MSFISNLFTAGLVDALWSEIWKFGLGTGLIILCLLAAFFSPVGKQAFCGIAFAVFIGLVVYGEGIKNEKVTCTAQKVQLLKQLHKDYTFIPKRKPSVFKWPF
jgi:hypothetical protein